jgi:murein DD-endopeptidase MepM/ murein hydrolase activator NlpD
LLLGAPGGAAPPPAGPTSAARAVAVRVLVAGQQPVSTPVVASPPRGQTFLDGFSHPADGSIVRTGAITIVTEAGTSKGGTANASSASDVTAISLFGGEITADGVSGRAKAAASGRTAVGDSTGATVTNLVVLGQAVQPQPNLRVQLADWGYADVVATGSDTAAPAGLHGYRAFTTGLDVHVTSDHGGLPAGSEIQIGYAEASAQTSPPQAPKPKPKTKPGAAGKSNRIHDEKPGPRSKPVLTKEQQLRKLARTGQLKITPPLTAGSYVFPVFGKSGYGDTFGALRNDVHGKYHHGDDIFGQIGQPLLAVADGTLFSVGFQKVGGYRLWLRDRAGNQFYYAHLSAYAAAARNGAHVKAGAVIGFMGTTGDAFGTFPHLHFEVHPVSLLFLGYDGAVNPTSYLNSWRHVDDIKFPAIAGWAPPIHGSVKAPTPGAILLGSADISSADGLDPGSLERALKAPFQKQEADTTPRPSITRPG